MGPPTSRQELRDQLLTLLLAGHETSAVSIAWALYELDRHPDVLQKLLNEIESLPLDCAPDDLIALPYLEAVVKETLRLHAVTPNVPKQLNVPMQIGRYRLPAGAGVTIAFGAVHQRPELYPEPTMFRPDRFLERKFSPFERSACSAVAIAGALAQPSLCTRSGSSSPSFFGAFAFATREARRSGRSCAASRSDRRAACQWCSSPGESRSGDGRATTFEAMRPSRHERRRLRLGRDAGAVGRRHGHGRRRSRDRNAPGTRWRFERPPSRTTAETALERSRSPRRCCRWPIPRTTSTGPRTS